MNARRAIRTASALLLLALCGAPGGAGPAPAKKPSEPPATQAIRHPEDLFVVDCLLPAKVRSLGRHTKFVAPRKVVRTTAHECALRHGEFSQDPEDNAFALQSWLSQAEAGDPEAMNNVGEIYEQGVRGAPDYGEAAAWYRRAAEAGSRRGQRNLAALYETGSGVGQDLEQAVAWYRKAAGLTGPAELSAEREAAALRDELAAARAEGAEARAEIERLNAALDGARTDLAGAERELGSLRAKLADRADDRRAASEADAAAVAAKEAELAAKRQKIADLEAAQDRFRTLLAEVEAAETAAARSKSVGGATLLAKRAPAIEFVRPDVLATRGPTLAPVAAGARDAEVVGRVTAELGLASFTVDGRPQKVDDTGYFSVRLPVDPARTVRFVAVDSAARRSEAELRFVLPTSQVAPASTRAASDAPAKPSGRARRGHALILANGAYRALPALATAHADGRELAQVLSEEYGYEVRLLEDATFLDTMLALSELGKGLGVNDDLLVYFAGHGRIDEQTGKGYWLPADADPEDRSTWLPNDALARQLGISAAGRVLVVSDSCYAGTLAASGLEAQSAGSGAGRSRTVLASGGLQPVLDAGGGDGHSIFARALLSVLKLAREATPATSVASAVAARVGFKAAQLGIAQTPVYAPIRHAGHEAGDFVFVPRG